MVEQRCEERLVTDSVSGKANVFSLFEQMNGTLEYIYGHQQPQLYRPKTLLRYPVLRGNGGALYTFSLLD
jgi:hypothetical protein